VLAQPSPGAPPYSSDSSRGAYRRRHSLRHFCTSPLIQLKSGAWPKSEHGTSVAAGSCRGAGASGAGGGGSGAGASSGASITRPNDSCASSIVSCTACATVGEASRQSLAAASSMVGGFSGTSSLALATMTDLACAVGACFSAAVNVLTAAGRAPLISQPVRAV